MSVRNFSPGPRGHVNVARGEIELGAVFLEGVVPENPERHVLVAVVLNFGSRLAAEAKAIVEQAHPARDRREVAARRLVHRFAQDTDFQPERDLLADELFELRQLVQERGVIAHGGQLEIGAVLFEFLRLQIELLVLGVVIGLLAENAAFDRTHRLQRAAPDRRGVERRAGRSGQRFGGRVGDALGQIRRRGIELLLISILVNRVPQRFLCVQRLVQDSDLRHVGVELGHQNL